MIKKLLLMVALVASLFSSAEADIDLSATAEGKVTIILSRYNEGTKDWIGIYKHGASNDWGNVQQWSWLDNTEENGMDHLIRYMDIGDLPEGTYDIRYFLKNSYNVYESTTVTLKKDERNPARLRAQLLGFNYDFLNVYEEGSIKGHKDWIGVFKKGASNDWGNVLMWAWCDDDLSHLPVTLQPGTYDVRLFYDNSYNVAAETGFTVPDNGNRQASILYADQDDEGRRDKIFFETTTSGKGNKDWIGLFKIGASNTWNNVLAWSWIDPTYVDFAPRIYLKNVPAGTYELRLFYHNSYKVEDTSRINIHY